MALVACGDDDETASSVTVPAGDPITVEQLVARSADSPITVRGLLLATGGETRLCAAILESFPPQCGEPSVVLVEIDPASVDGIEQAGDVIWKEGRCPAGATPTRRHLPGALEPVLNPGQHRFRG